VEIAQAKIEKLRQGAGTAMEYFTLLDTYNNTAGYDETTLIRLLKQGILKPVLQSVYGQTALPITYADWKVVVIKHNRLRRAFYVMDGALRDRLITVPKVQQNQNPGNFFHRNEQRAPANPLVAFIKEHVETRRIHPSKSPWASPFFFVKKKDGKLRPIQDYRKLNSLTIKNRYPLPLISEIMHMLRKATCLPKLDVQWGYDNIRIKEGDEEKAVFVTN
jgi:hypothetical protein